MINLKKDLVLSRNSKKYYDNFDTSVQGNTLEPGSMPADGLYEYWVNTYKPKLIVEVGSFLGYSAIKMAKEVKRQNLDTIIICVDTWLGSPEHYEMFKDKHDDRLGYINGYPTLYHKFISNVILNDVHEIINPFPYPSSIAYKILDKLFTKHNTKADFIFVDGSHEDIDVYFDLYYYYQLLADGGVIWGDDWAWGSVKDGVNRFLDENNLRNRFTLLSNGVHWLIQK